MSETHSSIMARLMPLYEMAPERFMAFYDAVYLMCVDDMEYVRRTTGFKPSGNRFIPKWRKG